jgi:hypothetical protein
MTKVNTIKRSILKKTTMSFGLLVALTGFTSMAHATYSLPASRSVVWQGNAGVKGDIPNLSTIYKTLSPSGGDDTSAIKTAISGCPAGQVIKLAAGTFKISSPIIVKSGVVLRGSGMGTTKIQGASGMGGGYLIGFNASPAVGTYYTLTAGIAKGSSTITTSQAHGWKVGDMILIDQLNNDSGDPPVTSAGTNGTCTWCGRNGNRSLGQVSMVTAVPSSTTATLEIPLYWNYQASLTPQAAKVSGVTSKAGIENLTVDNSLSGSSSQTGEGGTVVMYGTSNCWLLNVEAIGSYTNMLRMKRSYRDTVRGCKFHEGTPALPATGSQYNTSRAYCIYMSPTSAALVEGTQIYHLDMATKLDGNVSGNVFAYNYISGMYYAPSASWQVDSFRFHGGHPMMNLFEGNYTVGRINADNVWGSSSHNTFFRNRNILESARTQAAWDYSLYTKSHYYNIIGNVIGTTGFENAYQVNIGSSSKAILGIDTAVSTTLLHANWDSLNNRVVYNSSLDTALPSSMYLTGKPAWWGSTQWPAIGPDVSPMSPSMPGTGNGIPWYNGSGYGSGSGSTTASAMPSAPTNLAAK